MIPKAIIYKFLQIINGTTGSNPRFNAKYSFDKSAINMQASFFNDGDVGGRHTRYPVITSKEYIEFRKFTKMIVKYTVYVSSNANSACNVNLQVKDTDASISASHSSTGVSSLQTLTLNTQSVAKDAKIVISL